MSPSKDLSPEQAARWFRQNVTIRREELGLTQGDVAARMSDLGFAFRQQTVQKIESGDRSVKVEEAHALAGILVSEVDILMMPPAPEYVELGLRRLEQMKEAAVAALGRYEAARMDAEQRIEAVMGDENVEVFGGADEIRKKLKLVGPSVEDLRAEFDSRTPWFRVTSRAPRWYWEREFQGQGINEFRFS